MSVESTKDIDFDDACIICLEIINRNDPVWGCSTCAAEYHLGCICDWIQKLVLSKEELLNFEVNNLNLSDGHHIAQRVIDKLKDDMNFWSCPKCRRNYSQSDRPSGYYCFCGKLKDPPDNKWLQPHTCGERCEKLFEPYCGDRCNELCHRGPCGPCPKYIKSATCYCGRKTKKGIRCSQRFWSCNEVCGKLLKCSIHSCNKPCHQNECGVCEEIVLKECECGAKSKEIKCSESWKCSKDCKEINLEMLNKCPCGKTDLTKLNSSGDEILYKTCINACSKLFDCGIHKCQQKCHVGDCGLCKKIVSKTCKCGLVTASVQCHKEFNCGNKCQRKKNCGRHLCKRKCCDASSCAECDLICNRTLNCNRHRCQMRCHNGPCYPCQLTVEIACACGSTKKTVACGVKTELHKYLTQRCKSSCNIPSKCKHDNIHKCHLTSTDCPPCNQKCLSALDCGHSCQSICHDAVKTKIKLDKSKLAGPWEAKLDGKIIFEKRPCPPCDTEMGIICMGAHEEIKYSCWRQLSFQSCGSSCGRKLSCGWHFCQKVCHPISEKMIPKSLIEDTSKEPALINYCEEPCQLQCTRRSCEHPCPRIVCHSGDCPPCTRYVSHKCHCGSLTLHLECKLGPNPPSEMLSCPSRCSGKLKKSCGHQCWQNCHPGPCLETNESKCRTKVTLTCPCNSYRLVMQCWKYREAVKKGEMKRKLQCHPIKCEKIKPDETSDSIQNSETKNLDYKTEKSDRVMWLKIIIGAVLIIMAGVLLSLFLWT